MKARTKDMIPNKQIFWIKTIKLFSIFVIKRSIFAPSLSNSNPFILLSVFLFLSWCKTFTETGKFALNKNRTLQKCNFYSPHLHTFTPFICLSINPFFFFDLAAELCLIQCGTHGPISGEVKVDYF